MYVASVQLASLQFTCDESDAVPVLVQLAELHEADVQLALDQLADAHEALAQLAELHEALVETVLAQLASLNTG